MIVSYVIRSLVMRARTSLVAVLVIGMTTAAITIVLGLSNGLQAIVEGPNRPNLIAIAEPMVQVEAESSVPADVLPSIRLATGIQMSGDKPLISPELVVSVIALQSGGAMQSVLVRGVDPIAFEVHPEVHVSSGSMPAAGTRSVVIGSRLVGRYEKFVQGGAIRIGRHWWPITGIITAPGEAAESEVWCNRTDLATETHHDDVSVIYAMLTSPDRIADVKAITTAMRDKHLDVLSAKEFRKHAFVRVAMYLTAINLVIAVLCISAIFAATSATYSIFIGQMGELGTLMAVGFTRRRVALMVLTQSLFLAICGAAVGLGVAMLANGYTFVFHEMMLVYQIQIVSKTLVLGGMTAAAVGIVGSMFAIVQTYQLNILRVLRD